MSVSHRRVSSGPETLVRVDPRLSLPLHRQIYGSLRDAILAGRLAPGTRVPATRALAAQLGVSRNTTSAALDQLRAEGYVEARARSGMFVAATLPDALLALRARARRAPLEPPRPGAIGSGHATRPRPFRTGLPALDAFPWTLWARLTSRRLRGPMHTLGGYGAPAGYAPLRAAIAEYVGAARGATCVAEQVIVTAGAQQALDLAARLLVAPGDAVWMEDPGYLGARSAFAAAGARIVAVPIDADGLSIEEGRRRAPDARVAYMTPSHQYPTGVVMTATRRLELLSWAERTGAWLLEDDYDSEFRYASRPLACLQGLDAHERVIYVGTFSKTMFPALRLGYLVSPPRLVDAFTAARGAADRHSPGVDQAVLADFVADGHHARHVRRMRMLYEERRDALLGAAADLLGERLVLAPSDAGMHVLGWLPTGVNDASVSRRAAALGVEATALSSYAIGAPARGGLLLGYAAFTPRALRSAVRTLAVALEG